MRTLRLNEGEYSLPGTWNELTTEQLVFLIGMVNKQVAVECNVDGKTRYGSLKVY